DYRVLRSRALVWALGFGIKAAVRAGVSRRPFLGTPLCIDSQSDAGADGGVGGRHHWRPARSPRRNPPTEAISGHRLAERGAEPGLAHSPEVDLHPVDEGYRDLVPVLPHVIG